MFVAHVPPEEGRSADAMPATASREPRVYINPVISKPEGAPESFSEGCLSLPEIRGDVLRSPVVTIEATDLNGQRFTERGAGLLARCWQHELDHLDGRAHHRPDVADLPPQEQGRHPRSRTIGGQAGTRRRP